MIDADTFTIEVEYHGPGFDPGALPSGPYLGDPSELGVDRGWGMQLMQALVDHLEFIGRPHGSVARLTVARKVY